MTGGQFLNFGTEHALGVPRGVTGGILVHLLVFVSSK